MLLILANGGFKIERKVKGVSLQYAVLWLCICLNSIQCLKERNYIKP